MLRANSGIPSPGLPCASADDAANPTTAAIAIAMANNDDDNRCPTQFIGTSLPGRPREANGPARHASTDHVCQYSPQVVAFRPIATETAPRAYDSAFTARITSLRTNS